MDEKTFRQDEVAAKLVAGAEVVLPLNTRNKWTKSRLVNLPSGPVPILQLLAVAAFGEYNPAEKYAYWKDRDWTNESVANVALGDLTVSRPRNQRMSKYGVPAGSREYHRQYRAENRDRINAYQRTRHRGMMELKKRFKTGELTEKSKIPQEAEAALGNALDEIMNLTAPPTEASGKPDA